MAIKITIPGVGDIEVEGAAQESTMQEILKAVSKSDKPKQAGEKKAQEVKKKETESTKKHGSALDQLIKEEKKAQDQMSAFSKQLDDTAVATAKSLGSFAGSLASTAATIAVSMIKNIDDNVSDPIQFGAKIIDTGIDMMASGLKIASDAVFGLADAALSIGGPLTEGAENASNKLAEVSKEVIDFGAAIAKAGNDFMAAEFSKTAKAMQEYTAAGASFAGGMTEMRDKANASGVGITTFANVIKESQATVHEFGMSASESAKILSNGMNALTKTVKTVNGVQINARDQLLNLGYGFEEQGPIMAQFMNQAKLAGKNLATLSDKEIATGVTEYAKNLKVISDLTGQDAKKLMEKAQAETNRSALLSKLDAKQQAAFQATFSTLMAAGPSMGPKLQIALEQMLAGGSVTDPIISGNKQVMDMLQKTVGQVNSGNAEMVANTRDNLTAAGKAFKESGQGVSTDFAALELQGQASSVVQGYSELGNALNNLSLATDDSGKKSAEAATKQLTTIDAVSTGYTKATEAVTQFQVKTETLATNLMPQYATAIAKATTTVSQAVQDAMDIASGKKTVEQVAKEHGVAGHGGKDIKETGKDTLEGATAGAISGAVIGSVIPVIGTATGAIIGGLIGGLAGYTSDPNAPGTGKSGRFASMKPKAANGGVLSGPTSGFDATLHGTEAVVPLPDGKSIPVSLDMSGLVSAINNQTMVLHQVAKNTDDTKKYTSQLVQLTS